MRCPEHAATAVNLGPGSLMRMVGCVEHDFAFACTAVSEYHRHEPLGVTIYVVVCRRCGEVRRRWVGDHA